MKKADEIVNSFKGKNVLVVGDVMLDRYTFGEVVKISPEAPVPVVRKTAEKFVLGGAANVAANVAAFGANAFLFGIVGDDHNKDILSDLLAKKGIDAKGLFVHKTKPTILKHRIVSGPNHQMIRVDEEDIAPLDERTESEFVKRIGAKLKESDIVIFSDYAKGVFSKMLAKTVIDAAKKYGKKVVADVKPENKEFFVGVYAVSPNLKEGKEMSGKEEVGEICRTLADFFGSDVLLTRGGDGISVFNRDAGIHSHVPGKKINVFDVSGAGDTAIAVAALALASGLDLHGAAVLANAAGAVVVQKAGTATLTSEELVSELELEHHIERVEEVPKVWGYEKWLENNDKYCSKLLSLNKGYQCSLHYHKVKDEMFIVTKGHVRLEVGDEVMHLREGGYARIAPGVKHRFAGIEDSTILEVSTHHDEGDSYRIEESRKS